MTYKKPWADQIPPCLDATEGFSQLVVSEAPHDNTCEIAACSLRVFLRVRRNFALGDDGIEIPIEKPEIAPAMMGSCLREEEWLASL